MQTSEFSYKLPDELIAKYPADERSASRLLQLSTDGKCIDLNFRQLPGLLSPGDLLVLNNTRVIPARLFAKKETGGKVEIMIERIKDEKTILAQLRASKPPKPGANLYLQDEMILVVKERQEDMYLLSFPGSGSITDLIESHGHMPLPPYINRDDETLDSERYQTVYSDKPGAVAAPTAGLHFTQEILDDLQEKNIDHVFLTLHVGAGTFQPVRVDDISKHKMHSEYMSIDEAVIKKINSVKENGGRIIAVGTTVVRSLETAAKNGKLNPYEGETDIFIYPGFQFNVVDHLITNFHLPESTLLMLVCAFAGKEQVMNAYQHAIDHKYRFYSYGDAMYLTKK